MSPTSEARERRTRARKEPNEVRGNLPLLTVGHIERVYCEVQTAWLVEPEPQTGVR